MPCITTVSCRRDSSKDVSPWLPALILSGQRSIEDEENKDVTSPSIKVIVLYFLLKKHLWYDVWLCYCVCSPLVQHRKLQLLSFSDDSSWDQEPLNRHCWLHKDISHCYYSSVTHLCIHRYSHLSSDPDVLLLERWSDCDSNPAPWLCSCSENTQTSCFIRSQWQALRFVFELTAKASANHLASSSVNLFPVTVNTVITIELTVRGHETWRCTKYLKVLRIWWKCFPGAF